MEERLDIRTNLTNFDDPLAVLETLFEHAPVSLQIFGLDGRSLLVNRAFVELFGSAPPPGYNVLSDEIASANGALGLVRRALAGETARIPTLWYEPRELRPASSAWGRRAAIEVTAFPLRDRRDAITHVAMLYRDLTVELTARAEAERLLALMRAERGRLPLAWVQTDLSLRVVEWNPAAERIFGHPRAEVLGRDLRQLGMTEAAYAQLQAIVQRLAVGEREAHCELECVLGDGRTVVCEWHNTPLLDEAGRVVGMIGLAIDMTDRYRAVQALRESEQRLATTLRSIGEAVIATDANGRVEHMNIAAELLTGWSQAEAHGRSLDDVFVTLDEQTRQPLESPLSRVQRGEEATSPARPALLVGRGGREHPVAESCAPIRRIDGRTVGVVLVFHDYSEEREARAALQDSERRYRQIVETASEGIWMIDEHSRTTFVNQRMAELLGYTPEQMQGRRFVDFLDPESRALHESSAQRRAAGLPHQTDFQFLRADGTTLHSLLSSTPILDERGGYRGAVAMVADLTERRQLEEQLRQSQKMEAIGRLAGGVAHDLNNMLTAVSGFGTLVQQALPEASPLRHDLRQLLDAAERATGLTRQLLAFSRKQVLRPIVLDVADHLLESERMLRRLIGEDVALVVQVDARLRKVKVDPSQFQQVILNLAVNARDAMPHGGQLTVTASNVHLDADQARLRPEVQPGQHVLVAVTDTGVGMDPAVLEHIFEPFFTTKAAGKGTGLGLATVFGIVQQSGGHIAVESEPGKGSTFMVYFPAVDEEAHAHPAPALDPRRVTGSETIMLVEDEDLVRHLIHRALYHEGYEILEAPGPEEALGIARAYRGPIHLLITDVVMPVMNGRQLAEQLLESRPEMRVLYMSGYTEDIITDRGVLADDTNFLEKPVALSVLSKKVREVLGGDAEA